MCILYTKNIYFINTYSYIYVTRQSAALSAHAWYVMPRKRQGMECLNIRYMQLGEKRRYIRNIIKIMIYILYRKQNGHES